MKTIESDMEWMRRELLRGKHLTQFSVMRELFNWKLASRIGDIIRKDGWKIEKRRIKINGQLSRAKEYFMTREAIAAAKAKRK